MLPFLYFPLVPLSFFVDVRLALPKLAFRFSSLTSLNRLVLVLSVVSTDIFIGTVLLAW